MVKCYNIGKPIYRSISNPHSDLSVQTHTAVLHNGAAELGVYQ